MGLEIGALLNPVALLGTLAMGGGQIYYQQKAYEQQKKVSKIQQGVADRQAQAQRRQEIRRAMIARANIENTAAQTGTAKTSSAVGAIGSVQSQTANNLATIRSNQLATSAQAKAQRRGARYEANAEMLGGLRSIGMDLFQMGMGAKG